MAVLLSHVDQHTLAGEGDQFVVTPDTEIAGKEKIAEQSCKTLFTILFCFVVIVVGWVLM